MRSELMTSTRPYLIRAFYDWIIDNDCTPHIVVNATLPGVNVPQEFVESGQIVLNISLSAVNGLVLGDQSIEFQGRFGGKVRHVHVPIMSIIAIYAKENGRGMVFAEEDEIDEEGQPSFLEAVDSLEDSEPDLDDDPDGRPRNKSKQGRRPHLTVVK